MQSFGHPGSFHLAAGPSSGVAGFSIQLEDGEDNKACLHRGDFYQPVLEGTH